MRVLVYGSELSTATAAAALSSVGHSVRWLPHDETPWSTLVGESWLRREPQLVAQIQEAEDSGALEIVRELDGGTAFDVVWLALSPSQRDSAAYWSITQPFRSAIPSGCRLSWANQA